MEAVLSGITPFGKVLSPFRFPKGKDQDLLGMKPGNRGGICWTVHESGQLHPPSSVGARTSQVDCAELDGAMRGTRPIRLAPLLFVAGRPREGFSSGSGAGDHAPSKTSRTFLANVPGPNGFARNGIPAIKMKDSCTALAVYPLVKITLRSAFALCIFS